MSSRAVAWLWAEGLAAEAPTPLPTTACEVEQVKANARSRAAADRASPPPRAPTALGSRVFLPHEPSVWALPSHSASLAQPVNKEAKGREGRRGRVFLPRGVEQQKASLLT